MVQQGNTVVPQYLPPSLTLILSDESEVKKEEKGKKQGGFSKFMENYTISKLKECMQRMNASTILPEILKAFSQLLTTSLLLSVTFCYLGDNDMGKCLCPHKYPSAGYLSYLAEYSRGNTKF